MLTPDERSRLLLGTLSIRCPTLAVKPVRPDQAIAYSGHGALTRPRGGKLTLSLDGNAHLPPRLPFPRNAAATLTFPEDQPTLTATDEFGRQWEGSSVDVHYPWLAEHGGWSGTMAQLRTTSSAPTGAPALRILIPGDFALPVTEWRIGDGDAELTFTAPEGGLQVDVRCAGALPNNFDLRIEEALWFATGTISSALLVESVHEDTLSTTISSQTFPGTRSLFGGPLRPLPSTSAELADIFLRYLKYASGAPAERYHRTSAHLRLVHSSATIEQGALSVAVAVEAFVRHDHGSDGKPTALESEGFRSARQYMDGWNGPPDIKRRVIGMIGSMENFHAPTALRKMAESNVLLPSHWNSWSRIRNEFAHGSWHQDQERELIQDSAVVYQALLALILSRIGYAGRISDCTTPRCPTIGFPFKRPPEPAAQPK